MGGCGERRSGSSLTDVLALGRPGARSCWAAALLARLCPLPVFAHSMCNIPINVCNIQMKHLQRTSQTVETLPTYVKNTWEKHLKTLEIIANIRNIQVKHLQ
jgi:hypothetical protein